MSKIRKLQRRKSNPNLVRLIDTLLEEAAKNNAAVWKDVAERLAKPTGNYAEVNVSKLERYAKPEEYVIVPGKVLGAGKLSKPVKVAALSFSESAKRKISEAGGEFMTISELLKVNPSGSRIRIMA